MRRTNNQDAYRVVLADQDEWSSIGHQFIVADGMGAHAAGELASQLAVDQVGEQYQNSDRQPREALEAAFQSANTAIHQQGQEDTQLYNMGTTCSALMLLPGGALVGHVGDSRVYRCRNNQIQQLTFDHSLVWEMRAVGQLSQSVPDSAVPRNVITRCLGPHPDVDVDIEGLFSIQPNDTFLLCSDGLTGRISDAEIGAIASHLLPTEAADFLVDLANLRGGSDNITLIIVRVLSERVAAKGEVREDRPAPAAETHPAWWFVASAGLVAALVCYSYALFWQASVGALFFLLAAAGVVYQRFKMSDGAAERRRGTSPYVTASTAVDKGFVDEICDTLEATLEGIPQPNSSLDKVEVEINRTRAKVVEGASAMGSVCQTLADLAQRLRHHLS